MVNKDRIYATEVDGTTGIIVVDPNAVTDQDGVVKNRYILPEDLMIYVSLQAQMNPKTLIFDAENSTQTINVASGKFYSSTSKNTGQQNPINIDNADTTHFTTAWTEMYDASHPEDLEGFGIQSIDMEFNASLVPRIHIEFIDVRGKNLMERGGDPSNPYNVFYTTPYPLFQLTVKGYLGKAIQMPLLMEKAITKFDPSSGSYIISADFKSWTFGMLNDLILMYALIVPYMYKNAATGKYLGQEIVDQKYVKYWASKKGQEDLAVMESMGYGKADPNDANWKPLDRITPLNQLFLLSDTISKLVQDDILTKATSRSSAVAAFISELDRFKLVISTLAAGKNNSVTSFLDDEILKTNNFFRQEKAIITPLVTGSAEVFNVILDRVNYIDTDEKLTPMSEELYNKYKDPIIAFERLEQETDATEVKKTILNTVHFYPSIKNTVKAIVIHIDAFMELLRLKSEEILKSVQVKEITNPQINHEFLQAGDGKYRRMPWPEFYQLDQEKGNVKDYPGNGTLEQQRWIEVEFINEMYAASQALASVLTVEWSGVIPSQNVFLLTPLSSPTLLDKLSMSGNDPMTILNHLLQQILDSVYHNGWLYKIYEPNILLGKGAEGIYAVMIKNVIMLYNEEFKTNTNGRNILNLLKSQMAGLTTATQLSSFIGKNVGVFDGDPLSGASSIMNHLTLVSDSYAYQSDPLFAVGQTDYDHLQRTFKDLGDKLGVGQLSYNTKWADTLDLMNFNTTTMVRSVPTSALTFTNNYPTDDIFTTRL